MTWKEEEGGERIPTCLHSFGPDHREPPVSIFPWSESPEAAWLEAEITQPKEHHQIMQETAAVTSFFRIYIHKL